MNTLIAGLKLHTARLVGHHVVSVLCCACLLTPVAVTQAAQLDAIVIGADGKPLADAVVYLLPQHEGTALPKPKDTNIDQVNVTFVPAVNVLQTGTAVHFPNSDNIRHSVYSFSPPKNFTLKLYSGKPSAPITFDKAGLVVLGCNIHDQMTAWVLVVDTNLFAKTDANGKLSIKNIADGDYWLQAWHPGIRKPFDRQAVTFTTTATIDKPLTLDAVPVVPIKPAAAH